MRNTRSPMRNSMVSLRTCSVTSEKLGLFLRRPFGLPDCPGFHRVSLGGCPRPRDRASDVVGLIAAAPAAVIFACHSHHLRARRLERAADRIAPTASDFLERQTGIDVDGITTGEGLPAPDRDIDVARIDFESAGLPADPFGREQRRARATEGVEHNVVAVGAVFDRIGDESDRLDGRVRAQVVHAPGAKRVDAGVFPDIGA